MPVSDASEWQRVAEHSVGLSPAGQDAATFEGIDFEPPDV